MLNVVVPIVSNAKRFRKILAKLANVEDVNLFIGVVSSQIRELDMIEGDNVYKLEYKDGSNREEIINSLQKYLNVGSILILRKPISEQELNGFLNSDKDVVSCRKNTSTFKNFFVDLWQKILKLCLGVKLYDGDTSAIYFAEDISTVILGSSNLSYNSRVDRWKGIEQGTIIVDGDAVKTDVDKKLNIRNVIISLVALLVGATVTTVVSIFATVIIIVGLLLFCLDVICVMIVLILLVMTIFNCMVGKKNFGFAAEVESDDEFDDDEFDLDFAGKNAPDEEYDTYENDDEKENNDSDFNEEDENE